MTPPDRNTPAPSASADGSAGSAGQPAAVPCYVSGKGMHATQTTWDFKTLVIATLESTGLGYDTRYRYYQERFPDMDPAALARLICDPIEYYDTDWPAYLASRGGTVDEAWAVTEFMLERDRIFRAEARAAVYCYDEAGFGSGVNSLRFLSAGKPILGFYRGARGAGTLNLGNVLQLAVEYPDLVTLVPYREIEEIAPVLTDWLQDRAADQASGPSS